MDRFFCRISPIILPLERRRLSESFVRRVPHRILLQAIPSEKKTFPFAFHPVDRNIFLSSVMMMSSGPRLTTPILSKPQTGNIIVQVANPDSTQSKPVDKRKPFGWEIAPQSVVFSASSNSDLTTQLMQDLEAHGKGTCRSRSDFLPRCSFVQIPKNKSRSSIRISLECNRRPTKIEIFVRESFVTGRLFHIPSTKRD